MSQRPNVDSPSVCRVALNEEDHEKSSSVVVVLLIHFSYLVDFFFFLKCTWLAEANHYYLKTRRCICLFVNHPMCYKISHLI